MLIGSRKAKAMRRTARTYQRALWRTRRDSFINARSRNQNRRNRSATHIDGEILAARSARVLKKNILTVQNWPKLYWKWEMLRCIGHYFTNVDEYWFINYYDRPFCYVEISSRIIIKSSYWLSFLLLIHSWRHPFTLQCRRKLLKDLKLVTGLRAFVCKRKPSSQIETLSFILRIPLALVFTRRIFGVTNL